VLSSINELLCKFNTAIVIDANLGNNIGRVIVPNHPISNFYLTTHEESPVLGS